jgi:hypothetical protein
MTLEVNRIAVGGLDLNRPAERVEVFKLYKGTNIDRMPDLLADGRVPMTFAQIMYRRLDVLATDMTGDELMGAWWLNYADSGDGARRHPDGTLKVAYDSVTLRTLNPKSRLSSGALVLTPEQYAHGNGPEFTTKQVDTYTGHLHASVAHVMDNPIYVDGLARGDKVLARAYAQAVFMFAKQWSASDEAVGIHAPCIDLRSPVERLWCADALNNTSFYRAGADGLVNLNGGYGRLVGVALRGARPTSKY